MASACLNTSRLRSVISAKLPIGVGTRNSFITPLISSQPEIIHFHYLIYEQLFAGFIYFSFCFFFSSSFHHQRNVFTDTHIANLRQTQVMHAFGYRLTLWVKQFFKG